MNAVVDSEDLVIRRDEKFVNGFNENNIELRIWRDYPDFKSTTSELYQYFSGRIS